MSGGIDAPQYRSSGADAWPMIAVEEALAIVLRDARPLSEVQKPLAKTLGRIAAHDVIAHDALPPFAASVKDGYAVVAADGAGERTVAQSITAGDVAEMFLQPGQVAYITTGAPMPPGADAVVQVEDTEVVDANDGAESVRILRAVQPGNDVRPVGSDIMPGDVVVRAGTRLGAAEIGLLATVGAVQVGVHQRPRVGILSTGNELVPPDQPLRPGAIRESNGAMLAAAVRSAGGVPVELGIVRDEEALLHSVIATAQRECDVLLSTGGVSMGELDLMKRLAADLGTVHFGRLRMKPGKPCTFATLPRPAGAGDGRDLLYFGLPGNPVSALATFYLLALPAIRALAGWREPGLPQVQVTLAQSLPLDTIRPEYHRATLVWDTSLNGGNGGWLARSTGSQASSRLPSFSGANALLVLPQGEGKLEAGSIVSALLLPGENRDKWHS